MSLPLVFFSFPQNDLQTLDGVENLRGSHAGSAHTGTFFARDAHVEVTHRVS